MKITGESSTAVAIGPKKRKTIPLGVKLFLLVLPFLVLVFLFSYYPLNGWRYAFYDYRAPLKLSQCDYVGWKWFKYLFSNSMQVRQLMKVLRNTFAMSGLTLLTSFLPVIFAIFLNEIKCKWFKTLVQTLTTLPNFISWVLVYAVAFALFSDTGMVNTVLQNMGITTSVVKFLDSDAHTWLAMLLWSTWKGLGWGSIMYLAAIAGTDQELYEAARVDGAGRFRLMRHITLPALMPTFFVLLMMSVANFLTNGLDQYFVFSNPFNMEHIQVLDLYVYKLGWSPNGIPLATAIGMLKSLVSVILFCVVNFISKKTRGESIM